jgi:hypothetical protein
MGAGSSSSCLHLFLKAALLPKNLKLFREFFRQAAVER